MAKKSSGIKLLPLWVFLAFVVGGVLGWQILGGTSDQTLIPLTSEDVDAVCAGPTDSTLGTNDQLLRAVGTVYKGSTFGEICAGEGYGGFRFATKTSKGYVIHCEGGDLITSTK